MVWSPLGASYSVDVFWHLHRHCTWHHLSNWYLGLRLDLHCHLSRHHLQSRYQRLFRQLVDQLSFHLQIYTSTPSLQNHLCSSLLTLICTWRSSSSNSKTCNKTDTNAITEAHNLETFHYQHYIAILRYASANTSDYFGTHISDYINTHIVPCICIIFEAYRDKSLYWLYRSLSHHLNPVSVSTLSCSDTILVPYRSRKGQESTIFIWERRQLFQKFRLIIISVCGHTLMLVKTVTDNFVFSPIPCKIFGLNFSILHFLIFFTLIFQCVAQTPRASVVRIMYIYIVND